MNSIFVSGEFAPPIAFSPPVGAVLMREGEEEDKRFRDATVRYNIINGR